MSSKEVRFLTEQPCIQTMKCYSVIKRNYWYVQQMSGSQGVYTGKKVDTEGWCCMIPLCLLACFGFILFYFWWHLWCLWCGTVFKEKSWGGLLALFILIVLWPLPKLIERCAMTVYLPIFELKKKWRAKQNNISPETKHKAKTCYFLNVIKHRNIYSQNTIHKHDNVTKC